uniref:Glycosyltransferase 2-like domain-containing protein n=1 Tax=viral metagenome TaxID=1070528 RepID=A0A6C0H6P3_9ZZZZ
MYLFYLKNIKELYDKVEKTVLNEYELFDKKKCDLIFDNTIFDDLTKIENFIHSYDYLYSKGIYIIGNINNKDEYINHLEFILHQFYYYYIPPLSTMVLIKKENDNNLIIITPCSRLNNLHKIFETIDFKKTKYWIIIHDSVDQKVFNHCQIIELNHINEDSIYGNAQRNYGLDYLYNNNLNDQNSFIYFLDDDNIIHSDFYGIIPLLVENYFYTFDVDCDYLLGNKIEMGKIDTSMFLIHTNLCINKRWIIDKYESNFYFIKDIYENNPENMIYINNILAFYNQLNDI